MIRNALVHNARAGLVAAALLAVACNTAPNPVATKQVDDYTKAFAPSKASPLATAVEVNAPKLETDAEGIVRLTGTSEVRSIKVRALESKEWKNVSSIVVRAEPKLDGVKADALIAAVVNGVNAKSGNVQVYETTIAVELDDVKLPTLKANTERLTLFVHLCDSSSGALAAMAVNQGALNAIGTIRIGGDDMQ